MTAYGIVCSACSSPLPPELWTGDERTGDERKACPMCRAPVLVKIYPAFLGSKAGSIPQPLAADTEASCFYHPQNRASSPCDECGRFLCDLCKLEFSGRTVCPVCFEADLHGRKSPQLETSRTMQDTIALALATIPAFMFWPVLITAPLTLFWIVRHWNSPGSILPRTRVRFYLAGFFAVAEIGLIVAVVILFLTVRR